MSKSVWKYTLNFADYQVVSMPPNSKVLTAQACGDEICIWALVNPSDETREEHPVWVYKTGLSVVEAAKQGRYVASVQFDDGESVYHVFVGLGA